ncbi:MAG TPA: HD domain-containing protein [Acholeplasmataceae bacterium]|nr:HD domain-containing protein [Acholeplasmataceae bacterium]
MKTAATYEKLLWKKYQEAQSPEIEERFRHSLGVKDKALELIDTFGLPLNKEKAAIAGVLHDYAKFESMERFREIIKKNKFDEGILRMKPEIWHSLLGPYVIREELGLDDPEILSAVQNHTLGSLNMGLLEEVIYLADFTEENRKGTVFEKAKRLSKVDYYGAILAKIEALLQIFPDEHNRKLYKKYTEVKCRF